MKLSVIVAFRDHSEEQDRARTWKWLSNHYKWKLPEVEVVVASDDGIDPFHKTVALNRAVEQASEDYLMLADADTWCPSGQVRAGVEMVETDPTIWVRPWNIKLKMGPDDTERLLDNKQPWNEELPVGADHHTRYESLNTYWAAPPHIFTRQQLESVGGFDERFRGWGQEDEAFALAMRAVVGRPKVFAGRAYHFYHPRIGKSGHDQWVGETDPGANEALVAEYRKLVRYPDQMRDMVTSR